MIERQGEAGRWLVGVLTTLVALAFHVVMHPVVPGISHLPFVLAIALISMISGRAPAAFALTIGVSVIVLRMIDGSTPLPASLVVRGGVLAGYLGLGSLLIYAGHSARHHAQESRRTRAEFDRALAAADVGTWNFDFVKERVHYSVNVGPMMGRAPGFVHGGLQDFRRDIHPDDLPAFDEALQAASNGSGNYEARYRIRTPTGEWRWQLARGRMTRDEQGVITRADGIVMDITALRTAELDRWRSSEELRTLLDLIPAGVAVAHDREANQITVSARFAALLGITHVANASKTGDERDKLPNRCMRNGMEIPGHELPMQRAARTGREVHDVELDLVFADGRVLHLLSSAAPLYDADGQVRGAIGVHTDITALKQAQRELERADRQKDIFLATLAHELRNPLAPVRYAAAMLRSSRDDALVLEAARIIERQAAHMGQLLDQLLDISRVTRDVIELRRDTIDLARVLRHEVDAVRPRLAELSLGLEVGSTSAAWVIGDEVRLRQIVSNLLGNAAKFTHAGGRISVGLGGTETEVELAVRDTGIGIAQADLPHVFDLFTQVRSSGIGAGLGIGLAVVRRLVQLHGGRITARSAGLGAGTEFVVVLPRAAAPVQAALDSTAPADQHREETRVLVCDDNVDAADSLAELLKLHGFAVQVAHDGNRAKEIAAEFRPDVALLDLGLPDITGEEVGRWLRAQDWGAEATLIAVTGWGQTQDRVRTAAAGFDHHLVKPVDPRELIELLERREGTVDA
jgi:PAS domain S-box-containing protein